MRAWQEQKFDPSRPVYARKKLIADGVLYMPNKHIDWLERGLNPRRIRQMFDAHYVVQPAPAEVVAE